ncbi:MAG: hypothetical protein AAF352_01165 [Pseudomonadota bacterium]
MMRVDEVKSILKRPITQSVILHAIVVLIAAIGLPKSDFRPRAVEAGIAVTISSEPPPLEIAPPKQVVKEPEPPPPSPRVAPKIPMATKPVPAPEKPTPAPKPQPAPTSAPAAAPQAKASVAPPKPTQQSEAPTAPAPKIEPDNREERTKRLASLLKSVTQEETEPVVEQPEPDSDLQELSRAIGEQLQQREQAPAAITSLELIALRSQIAQCWNIPAGARDAENLLIDVRIIVNPDRSVRSAEVVNPQSNNPFWSIAAESAVRAVLHPGCQPLALPSEKYDLWKEMIFTFDPRNMF